jgi:hypothetical protein
MFEKQPDQLASLKVQMMDKTAYCTQRHIILLDDTAKNLKEGMSTQASGFTCHHTIANKLSQKIGSLTRLSLKPTTLLAFFRSIYDPTHRFSSTNKQRRMGMRGLGLFRRCIFDVCVLWYCLRCVSGFSLALGILPLRWDDTVAWLRCENAHTYGR